MAKHEHPLSDMEYDWITVIQNKAQALVAYDKFIKDAEEANSPECAALLRRIHDDDARHLAEARQHLLAIMNGKMANK